MEIENYNLHAKKLNMLAEIKIFEELKEIHKNEGHKHPFIHLCLKCNIYCDQILNDYIIYQNDLHAKKFEEDRLTKIEELQKKAIDEDIKEQFYRDSIKYDRNGNISECKGVC